MVRDELEPEIAERATARYTATLTDETGVGIAASSLNTLTLTLYDDTADKTIINSCNRANILNAGRGTLDSSGNLVITLEVLDNIIINATKDFENHVMLIEWTYGSGLKAGRKEAIIRVRNLNKVPA